MLIKVLATGFFAREDTKTPVVVAALCLLANVAVILATIGTWGHVGIALATSTASWLNAGLLAFLLARRGGLEPSPRLRGRALRLAASNLVLALLLLLAVGELAAIATAPGLALTIAAAAALYLTGVHLVGAADLGEIRAALVRRPTAPAGTGSGGTA